MDFQEFMRVAGGGLNWSDKSLNIVRALLVDEMSLGSVAAEFEVTRQHANVLRTRFLKRADDMRLKDYVAQVRPDGVPQLHDYESQIRTLQGKGYTAPQIVDFLESLGVTGVTPKDVSAFIRSLSK